MNRSEVWASYTPEERAKRGAAISAGKFRGAAKRKRPCKVCGKPIPPYRKYCSRNCLYADHSWRKGPPRKKRGVCKICGGVIETTRNELYCSAKCHLSDPKFKEDVDRGHAISWLPEKRIQAADVMRGRPQEAVLTAKGPDHCRATDYWLRSPDGRIFHGRNILEFVRQHPDLFDPEDVVWKVPGYRSASKVLGLLRIPTKTCRAAKGLSNLFGNRPDVRYSWKGWTRK
jgi:predicted nucleic acid-binding Zn ribbon protein